MTNLEWHLRIRHQMWLNLVIMIISFYRIVHFYLPYLVSTFAWDFCVGRKQKHYINIQNRRSLIIISFIESLAHFLVYPKMTRHEDQISRERKRESWKKLWTKTWWKVNESYEIYNGYNSCFHLQSHTKFQSSKRIMEELN